MTASGKTAAFVAAVADLKLGEHRGARRVWLEGPRLSNAGFRKGSAYAVRPTADGALELRLSSKGDRKVSGSADRPVIDLLSQQVAAVLGDVERVTATFTRGQVTIGLHPMDALVRERLQRLNGRLQAGQPIRLGSICHGGGVASDALLRGLGNAELAFAQDIDGRYLDQSIQHGPLSKGALSIERSIAQVDPTILPEVDVLEAGVPCVAASRAGRSKKHLDRPEADPLVGHLVYGFLRIVEATRPAVVVLENVPEYAASASADIVRGQLAEWGYDLHEQVCDGAEWALEARQRWILVASTRGLTIDVALLATQHDRPATLGDVLDRKVSADRWHRSSGREAHEARHAAKGNGFRQQLLTPESTRVPVLRRGYQKGGTTDPRLVHPTRKGVSRLLTPAEHARVKGIPPALVRGLSDKVAHEVLGQSVISPAFVALGRAIGQGAAA